MLRRHAAPLLVLLAAADSKGLLAGPARAVPAGLRGCCGQPRNIAPRSPPTVHAPSLTVTGRAGAPRLGSTGRFAVGALDRILEPLIGEDDESSCEGDPLCLLPEAEDLVWEAPVRSEFREAQRASIAADEDDGVDLHALDASILRVIAQRADEPIVAQYKPAGRWLWAHTAPVILNYHLQNTKLPLPLFADHGATFCEVVCHGEGLS